MDPYERLSRHLARVMAQEPSTPRHVSMVDLLPLVVPLPQIRSRLRTVGVLGAIYLVALIVTAGFGKAIVAVVGGVVVLVPAWAAIRGLARLRRALRRGELTTADVHRLRASDGAVRGTCEVTSAGRLRFHTTAPWAAELGPGDRILVIVDPVHGDVPWVVARVDA